MSIEMSNLDFFWWGSSPQVRMSATPPTPWSVAEWEVWMPAVSCGPSKFCQESEDRSGWAAVCLYWDLSRQRPLSYKSWLCGPCLFTWPKGKSASSSAASQLVSSSKTTCGFRLLLVKVSPYFSRNILMQPGDHSAPSHFTKL
jgi:hypothetical protein